MCVKCVDGYYLRDAECVIIPISKNCLQIRGDLCTKCLKDFILEDGICRDPLDYIELECESDNIDGKTGYSGQMCHYCKENAVPFNYKDSYICVEDSYM